MKLLSVKIPAELQRILEAEVKKRKTTKSSLVREALESFIKQDKVKASGSILDLARDLVGCCEGPEDLSTNKKYMEGFGR